MKLLCLLGLLSSMTMAVTLQDIHDEYLLQYSNGTVVELIKSKQEWQALLPADKYKIMWEQGTERAFSGEYDKHYKQGTYRCGSCGNFLFHSKHKFDSKTGWPSFWQPFSQESVKLVEDRHLFWLPRIEVVCARCGAHLGHVFDDGPEPTGKRYCINSLALEFLPEENHA